MSDKKKDQAPPASANVSIVNKLSGKVIVGDIKKAAAGFLYRIMGLCHDTKIVVTNYGESIGLKGQFHAVAENGDQYESGTCYLPEMATTLIVSQLKSEGTDQVQFAFDIYKKLDETAATGYVYEVKPVFAAKENNPFEIFKDLPALPAPGKK